MAASARSIITIVTINPIGLRTIGDIDGLDIAGGFDSAGDCARGCGMLRCAVGGMLGFAVGPNAETAGGMLGFVGGMLEFGGRLGCPRGEVGIRLSYCPYDGDGAAGTGVG